MSYAYLASTPGLKFNYSLYAVPAGWVISMAPLWWAIGKAGEGYDNSRPAESWRGLKEHLDEKTYGRVIRAVAANNNSHINLPLFAAALIAGNVAHLPSRLLHWTAGAYLSIRTLYNLAYILIEDDKTAYIRSILYLSGVGSCMTLFVAAAAKLKSVPW